MRAATASVKPDRRSIRLPGFDYSQEGAYFFTAVSDGRNSLFGSVNGDAVLLNDAGRILTRNWEGLPGRFSSVIIDAFVVMPNHVHGVVFIEPSDGPNEQLMLPEGSTANEAGVGAGSPRPRPSFNQIIGYFKYRTTAEINNSEGAHGRRIWQRGYFERVIRNEAELNRIREYIVTNPLRWVVDRENPAARRR